jgi:hypothetical protein
MWKRFRLIESHLHVAVKLFSERIAVIYPKDAFKEVNIDGNVEILPGIMVSQLSNHLRYLLSFQKHPLRNTWIFYFFFSDEDSLVWKIIVDENRPDSVIL